MKTIFTFIIAILTTNLYSQTTPDFPDFSWDKVQLYMHVRKNTAYTNQEITFLAKHPLITLEKSQAQGTYGSTEVGALVTANAIKAVSSIPKILYYRNCIIYWSSYANDDAFFNSNPDLLLKNASGQLVYAVNGISPHFNLAQVPMTNYWLQSVTNMLGNSSIDGVFVDATVKATSNYLQPDIGVTAKSASRDAFYTMMSDLKTNVGSNNIIIGNTLRVRPEDNSNGVNLVNQYFNGSYLESVEGTLFDMSYEDYLAEGITAFQTSARSGKILAMTLGLGEKLSELETATGMARKDLLSHPDLLAKVDYYLALFLICAEQYSYLYLSDGYLTTSSAVWLHTFDQFNKPLGAPLAYAVKNGYVYTRSFEHADVTIDIQNQTAEIIWDVSTLGTDEKSQNKSLVIYNNPVSDGNLRFVNEVSEVKIYNMIGQIVREYHFTSKEFDISNVSNGMYILKTVDPKGTKTAMRLMIK